MPRNDLSRESRCGGTSTIWTNYAGNQKVCARVVRPRSIAELVDQVREAGGRGGRLRAVATGLSFSDILQTDDTLAVMSDLHSTVEPGVLAPLEDDLWRDPTPREPRVRVTAGARIRELNDALAKAGLAFENLGGFDGQTFIGAFSTSTHGSGLALGPLSSAVRSIDLVSTGGALYRIEPTGGITDPEKFRRRYGASMSLRQRDDWFRACVVSLGCMGVLTAATVAVRASYRLVEHRRLDVWSRVRQDLHGRTPLTSFRHYEVLVNPYQRRDGDYTCLVTERWIAPPDAEVVPVPQSQIDATNTMFLPTTQEGLVRLMNAEPRAIPEILQFGLESLQTGADGRVDDSYRIFNLGKINSAHVLSGEYFVPLAGDAFLDAAERLLAVIASNRARGVFQTSPFSMRFVQNSDACLSMVHGPGPFCAIECPVFFEARGGLEALLSYEEVLYGAFARPHWGQIHELTGARGWLERAYPDLSTWRSIHHQLNDRGVFDNAFTDRLGLSVRPRSAP
ncbi:MAG TPA: D-arabinono-1,4-lactone oxidase [Polyangiaceae bacterium]|jgi:hypothetical protein